MNYKGLYENALTPKQEIKKTPLKEVSLQDFKNLTGPIPTEEYIELTQPILTREELEQEAKYVPETCSEYMFRAWHLFLPPVETYAELCLSYDKTYLVIITAIRCFLLGFLLKSFHDNFILSGINRYLFYVFGYFFAINLILLVFTMTKKQKYSKNDLNQN